MADWRNVSLLANIARGQGEGVEYTRKHLVQYIAWYWILNKLLGVDTYSTCTLIDTLTH